MGITNKIGVAGIYLLVSTIEIKERQDFHVPVTSLPNPVIGKSTFSLDCNFLGAAMNGLHLSHLLFHVLFCLLIFFFYDCYLLMSHCL